ncbi:MAG: endonuclease [Paludibacteraceae bacterium]|nr:endonuclease [Paludibacteraceae bacterium]
MKKHLFSFLALLIVAQISLAKSVTPAEDIPDYWASLNNKSGAALFDQLSTVTAVGYSSIGYDGLWTAYAKTDVYPQDSADRKGEVWDMYSACHFALSAHGSYSGECDHYNREHSVPQSWWGKGTSNQGCDIFHVLPTDGYVNNWRGNDPYGEVTSAKKTSTNGCMSGASKMSGYSGNVFEPADQYKGDIARGILGAMVKWKGNWTQGQGGSTFTGKYTAADNFGLTDYAVQLFMKWHRQDPVSQKEIDRNNGIQETQGNRNPFIDYPYIAEYIWGEHAGEAVDMSKLIASCEEGFVPGKSSGWRGEPVEPDKPVVKHGVTWSVNGETLRVDSVVENKRPASMPDEPESCSSESTEFMGWTDAPIESVSDDAPAVLYTAVADFPAVTDDVTYYAVFAHSEIQGAAEPAVYTFDATHSEGWTNTAFKSNSYWILRDGLYLESPAIDLSGLTAISMTMRTYGGTNYNTVDVTANGTKIATLKATGSSMTEQTWTNTSVLSGMSPLRFESTTSTASNGPAFSVVTINATGAGTTYSRYITSCQMTEEVELVPNDQSARKLLINGHIYIQTAEGLFTIQGQRIK